MRRCPGLSFLAFPYQSTPQKEEGASGPTPRLSHHQRIRPQP